MTGLTVLSVHCPRCGQPTGVKATALLPDVVLISDEKQDLVNAHLCEGI